MDNRIKTVIKSSLFFVIEYMLSLVSVCEAPSANAGLVFFVMGDMGIM